MKKIAFFVEGQTEALFIKRLLIEVAGQHNILLQQAYMHAKSMTNIQGSAPSGEKYLALIVDCRSESSVVSSIIDNHTSLSRSGYSQIVGIRDLYPLENSHLPKLKSSLVKLLPIGGAPCDVIIALREIESWFIQEQTHYNSIDPILTEKFVELSMNFDFSVDSAEELDWPSDWLKRSYQLAGKSYTKKKSHVERTVDALDMCKVYLELPSRLKSLAPLTCKIEDFLQ